ncbi:MAG: pyocin knob domain-containing protein [Muribaculaceae bacterium]|nr:pyocin knob domain-containing protein [Muribaculaceae bacterium]
MSGLTPLADILKAVQTASSLSGLSMLLLSSSGELLKKGVASFVTMNGTTLDANNATTFGFWTVGNRMLNGPSKLTPNTSDRILYLGGSDVYGVQMYVPLHLQHGIFFRSVMSRTWGGWRKLTLSEPE